MKYSLFLSTTSTNTFLQTAETPTALQKTAGINRWVQEMGVDPLLISESVLTIFESGVPYQTKSFTAKKWKSVGSFL